jgi:release factor glutamine methyltransferase
LIRTETFAVSLARADALALLAGIFRRSGAAEPVREARLALCAACGLTPADLIRAPARPLGAAAARLGEFAERRLLGEPLSRIVGRREFWGMALSISPDVLDPRPETETLVEAALELFRSRRDEALRILDLGVGSGAILCALLSEFPAAHGVGLDVSAAAAAVARRNVEACGASDRAEIRVGDWTDGLEGEFDLIVSNPPYVRSADIDRLPPDVRDYDPRVALDGGDDGLDGYRIILPSSAKLLAPEGWLLAEMGAGQEAELLSMAANAGYRDCASKMDLAGVARVLLAASPRASVGSCDRHGFAIAGA